MSDFPERNKLVSIYYSLFFVINIEPGPKNMNVGVLGISRFKGNRQIFHIQRKAQNRLHLG